MDRLLEKELGCGKIASTVQWQCIIRSLYNHTHFSAVTKPQGTLRLIDVAKRSVSFRK